MISRTIPEDPHFTQLAAALVEELRIRDGADYLVFETLNAAPDLQYAVVAYEGTTPAGCGALRELEPGIVELKRMFVPADHRRKGIASCILDALENWCRELEYHTVMLETGLNQPEAIALYRQKGYTGVPPFGKYTGSPNSICFQKKL